MRYSNIIPAALAMLYMSCAMTQSACATPPSAKSPAHPYTDFADQDYSYLFPHPKPYAKLRAKLLRQGWRPLITNIRYPGGDRSKEKEDGDAGLMLDTGFREIESCSGVELITAYLIFGKAIFA
jgi:hypothetical protein